MRVAQLVTGEGAHEVREDLVAYVRLTDGTRVKLHSGDPLPEGTSEADVERLSAAGVLEEDPVEPTAPAEPAPTAGRGRRGGQS